MYTMQLAVGVAVKFSHTSMVMHERLDQEVKTWSYIIIIGAACMSNLLNSALPIGYSYTLPVNIIHNVIVSASSSMPGYSMY